MSTYRFSGGSSQGLVDLMAVSEDPVYSSFMPSLHGLPSARIRCQRLASFTVTVSAPAPEAINRGSCVELSYIRHVVVKA